MVLHSHEVPNRTVFIRLGEFKTGGSFENNAITGATISPDALYFSIK
jgi:hypothetical protein